MTADIEKIATTAAKSEAVSAGRNSSSGSTLGISLATVLALLAIWAVAAAYGVVSPVFLPSPWTVAKALYSLNVTGFVDSTLAEHAFASLLRIFGGLAVSLVIGIPAGLAIATSRIGKGILDPIVEFLRPLPPLAYLPLVIIWVGIGEA